MARDLFSERCPQILAVPPELAAYQAWLTEQRATSKSRDYLFSASQPRFEPRKEDVVVALPGLSVRRTSGKTRLQCAQPAVDLELPATSARDAERILGALDGERCLLEARWEAKTDDATFARFLRATFGLVLFAPDAVASLEHRVSGVEITRFPSAPYGIERAYWDNMADVRVYFTSAEDVFSSRERFMARLREMHVLALMGQGLSSYYKPASPVSDRVVAPGALFLEPPRLLTTPRGTIFLDGPRVNVSLLGGHGYHRALYESVDDAEALDESRAFEVDGLPWGRVVTARSERDEGFGPWFCPPRPIVDGHWERLVTLLAAANQSAVAGEQRDTFNALAGFHQAFVRLHPFHCANQSIAMNLVNAILSRVVGAGIPHLVLDHLALRLCEDAYARVFTRAVRAFVVEADDPTRRLATLMDRKARSFSIIEALGRSRSRSDADGLLAGDPQGARFALLID